MRVQIVVTHLLGVGHLARAAAIARALAEAGHEVTLTSGGMPAPLVTPAAARLVQLPPVRSAGTAFSTLLDAAGQQASDDYLARRRNALLEAFREARPDVVLTELFPFGRRALAPEFLALLEAAHAARPRPIVLASIRDVLVAPRRPERIREAHERLFACYDGVLVHGDPTVLPLDESWPVDDRLRPLLHYTGYIDEAPSEPPSSGDGDEILVSGGGSAASLPLHGAAVEAAALVPDRPWRILIGAGIGADDFERLQAAAPTNAVVERTRSDFPALLARAAVSVSQAGYNTVVDLWRARARAILVPFEEDNETEQRLRADRMAARGLALVLPQAELTAARLAEAVVTALSRPRPDEAAIDRRGLARTVALVEAFAERRSRPPSGGLAWRGLDEALAAAADRGVDIDLWWRDDDAVAPTPALERLLAAARHFGAPLAIASIPARAEAGLADRLADEPLVDVLVHGLAHLNHAPASEKKAEFGDHRPAAVLNEEASRALALAREHFAARLVTAFVPPWNRIAPSLAKTLPQLGFSGLSSFGGKTLAAPGLVVVNTHLDPIDWHGRRSLRDEEALLKNLSAAIEGRVAGFYIGEPFGLLTHHLVHEAALWTFLERLLERLAGHRAVRFRSARSLFASSEVHAL